jgi:hypothetical protein
MTGICIAHLSGHGGDSGSIVGLALVGGVILVLLALAGVHVVRVRPPVVKVNPGDDL